MESTDDDANGLALPKPWQDRIRALVEEGVQDALSETLPAALRQATEKKYLTKRELMDLTGWSARTVEYKKTERKIPFIRRGRTILFPTEEVYEWLEEGRVEAKQ
jgi:excisionase family DNA binding protein